MKIIKYKTFENYMLCNNKTKTKTENEITRKTNMKKTEHTHTHTTKHTRKRCRRLDGRSGIRGRLSEDLPVGVPVLKQGKINIIVIIIIIII